MNPVYVYILKCNDGSYYTGHTDNIEKRLSDHLSEENFSYTATRLPINLVYLQEFAERNEAIVAEHQIKKWSRAKKDALINNDWEKLKLLAKKKKQA